MFRRITNTVAALLLLAMTGCGKGQATVSGTVSLDGKRLKFGSVLMVGDDLVSHAAEIGADGSYRIENVPFGNVRVAVTSIDPQENLVPKFENTRPGALGSKGPSAPVNNEGWFPIPAGYRDVSKSGLSLIVDQEQKLYDIGLTIKAPG